MSYHYKERKPEETIQIIEDFFNQHNITIKKNAHHHSEINTYSCQYSLYWKDKKLLTCNGKGISKAYSKASCYAELYERFCIYKLYFGDNLFIREDIIKSNQNKHGYNLYPNEKFLNKQEYLNNIYIQQFINNVLPLNQHLIGMPYQSLTDSNKITYQDFYPLFKQLGTTGLATGNTIEEALVQGCSELFERIVVEKFFKEVQDQYYLINYESEYINKLKQLGYNVYLYDLSYNFNLPVCFLLIYHPSYKTMYFKFGSAPVFDIAIERCFTELYQGLDTMIGNTLPNIELSGYQNNLTDYYIYKTNKGLLENGYTQLVCPDYILLHSKQMNNYNTKYYLQSSDYNNKQLLDFIKQIVKEHNIHLNWINLSLSNKIFAIQIVSEELLLNRNFSITKDFLELDETYRRKIISIYNYILKLLHTVKEKSIIYDNNLIEYHLQGLLSLFADIDKNIYNTLHYLNDLLGNNIYNIYSLMNVIEIKNNYNSFIDILLLSQNQQIDVNFSFRDSRKILWEQYQLFTTLKNEGHDKEYIKNIFNTLNLTFIDFDNYNSSIYIYLIYLLYIKNFYDLYNSKDYKDFINMISNMGYINEETTFI